MDDKDGDQTGDDSRLFRRLINNMYQWRVSISHLIYAPRGCAGIRVCNSSALQTRIPRQDSQASLDFGDTSLSCFTWLTSSLRF